MKFVLFVGLLSFGMTHAVRAQSLDIGGIELRIGQKVDEALRTLSLYQVQHNNGAWLVTQKLGNLYQFLGSIKAADNVISFIGKDFNISENESASEVYTRASREVRRRGGTTCTTREVEFTDGVVRAFETQCGPYKLQYFMPFKLTGGEPISGGVNISIRR